jgi:hypothetical protein
MIIPELLVETIIVSLGTFLGYAVKIVFKPSQQEAKLISRIIIGVLMGGLTFAKRYMKDHQKEHLERMGTEAYILRDKITKGEQGLG